MTDVLLLPNVPQVDRQAIWGEAFAGHFGLRDDPQNG